MKEKVSKKFGELYGSGAILFASPGRINLIGEHTDYNGGFVFPGAVDKGIVAAIKLNGTDKVRAYALDLGESAEFGLDEADKPAQSWACYIFGVCREIQKRGGKIGGFDTVFAGDVPLGAGMSSSAALESTYAFALNDLYSCGIDKFELAKIGQSTEHNYCGVNVGREIDSRVGETEDVGTASAGGLYLAQIRDDVLIDQLLHEFGDCRHADMQLFGQLRKRAFAVHRHVGDDVALDDTVLV